MNRNKIIDKVVKKNLLCYHNAVRVRTEVCDNREGGANPSQPPLL